VMGRAGPGRAAGAGRSRVGRPARAAGQGRAGRGRADGPRAWPGGARPRQAGLAADALLGGAWPRQAGLAVSTRCGAGPGGQRAAEARRGRVRRCRARCAVPGGVRPGQGRAAGMRCRMGSDRGRAVRGEQGPGRRRAGSRGGWCVGSREPGRRRAGKNVKMGWFERDSQIGCLWQTE
jgi:hypothetical protein